MFQDSTVVNYVSLINCKYIKKNLSVWDGNNETVSV